MSEALTPEMALELHQRHGGTRSAARAAGVPRTTFQRTLAKARLAAEEADREFEVPALPDPDVPIGELIDRLARDYGRKAAHAHATKLIAVEIKIDGPVGLLVFGDPHLDSALTNWPALLRDVRLVQNTEALFGTNLGDTIDNWGGKLAHLAGHNRATVKDANRLAHWFLHEVDWLLWLFGNHCWMRGEGDLVKWMVSHASILGADWAQRVALRLPNGREVRINHKHGFNGHSMWHTTHGMIKEMRFGARDHLYTGGHIHKGGINGPIVDANTGEWMWALQCGSYKDLSDNYGTRLGGAEQNAFPSAVVVINPDAKKPAGLVTIFPDTEEGADYLGFARRRWARGRRAA